MRGFVLREEDTATTIRTVLVTAFEPFAGARENPSAEILRLVARERIPGLTVATLLLPVDSVEAPRLLRAGLDSIRPHDLLCLGEARGATALRVERLAVNLLDFRVADNAGMRPVDVAVVEDGPVAYWSTLPARDMCAWIRRAGVPCELSMSAGTYLCNQVMYQALHWAATSHGALRVGFVHVPSAPSQQAPEESPLATMPADTSARAVCSVLEGLARPAARPCSLLRAPQEDVWVDDCIPVRIVEPTGAPWCGTVLLYHGLAASKAVQGKEMERLARGGFRVVAVDAPGHGERRWPDLEARLEGESSRLLLLRIVQEAVDEIPRLLDYLQDRDPGQTGRVAIAGISMGAYIAFAALGRAQRIRAAVPILGSPDWRTVLQGEANAEASLLLRHSPHLHPEGFRDKALLAFNAGRDVHVPPNPARHFVEQLRSRFSEVAERYTHVLYPESEHFMREGDWEDLLVRTVTWLQRTLG